MLQKMGNVTNTLMVELLNYTEVKRFHDEHPGS